MGSKRYMQQHRRKQAQYRETGRDNDIGRRSALPSHAQCHQRPNVPQERQGRRQYGQPVRSSRSRRQFNRKKYKSIPKSTAPAQCPMVFTRTGSWILSQSGILALTISDFRRPRAPML